MGKNPSTQASAHTPTPPTPAVEGWQIGLASIDFVLDNFAITRGAGVGGDMVDAMILAVIVEANVAPINQDLALARRFALDDGAPPDELRRPVSINAVAGSLSLPYETVRRRINRMVKAGACAMTDRGIVVPAAMLDTPGYLVAAQGRYEVLKLFYLRTREMRALDGVVRRPADAPRLIRAPIRAGNRMLSDYSLRVLENLMRSVGDPVSGVILLEMGRANAGRLTPDHLAADTPPGDAERTPIPTLSLARRVGLPPETVRRHVARLEAGGFCQRVRGGHLAHLERLGRDNGGRAVADNLQNVLRLFSKCAALGIVAWWEDELAVAAD